MNIFKRVLAFYKHFRRFDGASHSPFFGDWISYISGNQQQDDVARDLAALQARSYQSWQDSGFFKKYISIINANVIGPTGFTLQPPFKLENDSKKETWEEIIKWWGRYVDDDIYENNENMWMFAQKVLTSVIVFGEALIVKIESKQSSFGHKYRIVSGHEIAIFDQDKIDSYVKGGIHFSKNGDIKGYYLDITDKNRANLIGSNTTSGGYFYLPSKNVIRVLKNDIPGQIRGIPWIHAGLSGLKHLTEYRSAELVAARVSTNKIGIFKRKESFPMGYSGDDPKPPVMPQVKPGSFTVLPEGYDFSQWDPTHPNGSFGKFCQSVLLEISASLNVSLSSLSGDTSNVNFSTIRATMHEEREGYLMLQAWFSHYFLKPIFHDFLQSICLKSFVALPPSILNDVRYTTFSGRKWSYVDPIKDIKSQILAVQSGLKSRSKVCAEMGLKWEEILNELQIEKEKQYETGLCFTLNEDIGGDTQTTGDTYHGDQE